ncbi:hypothetical protein B0H11DRAFT_1754135, partial [Mycena galericulata]
QVALVTGGATGFGLAITAKLLPSNIVSIFLCPQTVSDSIDGDKIVLRGDSTKAEDWARAVNIIAEKWGRLDIVVNNVGINMIGKETHTVDEEFYDRLMNINVKSVYRSIIACAPIVLKQKSGVFVHISSVGALRSKPKIACYVRPKPQ